MAAADGYQERGRINDRNFHEEYFAKDVWLANGSRLLPRSTSLFDHFTYGAGALNSHVPQNWVTTETGTGTSHAVFAPATTGISTIIGVPGATIGNAQELAGKLVGWPPATMGLNKPLTMEARLKVVAQTTAADGDFYFGLADAVAYTSGIPYVIGASSLITTSVPVEFAGFGYSSVPSSGVLHPASGNNYVGIITEISTTPALAKSTGIKKDSSYHTYRVQVDHAGNAAFSIDDVLVGSTALAVTAATALTPYFNAVTINTSKAPTMTIDYIWVAGDLV